MKQYYLDYNATCPQLPKVTQVMAGVASTAFGNPSSLHWAGRNARRKLDDARETVAKFMAVESGSVVFTSGGTESNNIVIQSLISRWVEKQKKIGHIVLSAIEHPSVLQAVEQWTRRYQDWSFTLVKPDSDGKIDAEIFAQALTEDTCLACLMWANNETGVIQPVEEVVQVCKARGIPVLIDAVQALGKLDINLSALGADFVSFSAHKIGGPRGVGALVVRKGLQINSLLVGGGQERGRRSGTENVAGAVGFAESLGQLNYGKLVNLRDSFEKKLCKAIPDVHFFGQSHKRTGNTSMFCIPGLEGETLLMQMDLMGFAVASGSACSSGKRDPSHVLMAMGVPDFQSRSSLRLSFGFEHTEEVNDAIVEALLKIRARLRRMGGR